MAQSAAEAVANLNLISEDAAKDRYGNVPVQFEAIQHGIIIYECVNIYL